MESTGDAMTDIGDELPRFFQALLKAGAVDETQTRDLLSTDLSTGVGMLTALAKLNMIHSVATDTGSVSDDHWHPSWLISDGSTPYDAGVYIVSENNKSLFELLRSKVSEERSGVGEMFYIESEPGVGRTHLLSVLRSIASSKCHFLNVMDFELELESAVRRKERAAFFRWLFDADILLLDDLHHARGDTSLQKSLRHLIVANQQRGGLVIASGQRQVMAPDNFADDLMNTLISSSSSTLLTLELPDETGRLEILEKHFGNAEIPSDASQYLAENVNESIRQLMNAAGQLLNLSRQTATPITKDMARAVLPLPSDLRHPTTLPPYATTVFSDGGFVGDQGDRAGFFREILATAENEDEQALALQIAIGQRLRELNEQEHEAEYMAKLETALSLLRDGKLEEAIQCLG